MSVDWPTRVGKIVGEEIEAIRQAETKAGVQLGHRGYAGAHSDSDITGFYESRRLAFSFVRTVLE